MIGMSVFDRLEIRKCPQVLDVIPFFIYFNFFLSQEEAVRGAPAEEKRISQQQKPFVSH